jgi:hypothetical protein
MISQMHAEEADPEDAQQKRAGRLLKSLLDGRERGEKARLGRRLMDEGYSSGEQLPRRWAAGLGFTRANQRLVARLVRELSIAEIDDDYFDRAGGEARTPAPVTRHASLAAVLAKRSLRPETVKLLQSQSELLEIEDPGEQHWSNMATIFEGLFAAEEAVRGPAIPRGGPSRRR